MDIFLSRPTKLEPEYEAAYQTFDAHMASEGFILRRLGGGDYSRKAPLRAVIDIIHDCSGAIVLGYPQVHYLHEARRSTTVQSSFQHVSPTPWNQIEGALAYAHGAPTLVVAGPGIDGGVFDHGITGDAVLHVNLAEPNWFMRPEFSQPFAEWLNDVKAFHSGRAKS